MLFVDGKRPSELDRVSALDGADSFLISRNYNISTDNQFSKQVQFQTLVDDVDLNIASNTHISSMGYMQTNEYSRKNHGHDYSNIRVYARSPEFMSQFATDGTVSSIVELSVTNGTVEPIKIYCPKQQVSFRRRRTIGELKFLALNSLEPVDIDSPNFDGWVYPDGKEYPKNRFENAWRVFNTDPQSTTFRVPTLSTFIKPNPFPYNANSLSVVPAEAIGIPPHTHTINPSKSAIKDIKLQATTSIPGVNDSEGSGASHSIHARGTPHGTDVLRDDEYTLSIVKMNVSVYGGEFQTQYSDNETYPNHNLIPVKIYIGGEAS